MHTLLIFKNEVRIPENNDWVIFIILGSIVLYLIMFSSLQREATFKEFVLQPIQDSSNLFICFLMTSLVFILATTTLISQYIPIVPKAISEIQVLGFQLNKFGFTLFSLLFFYFVKSVLGFVFFQSVGKEKTGSPFYFVATKFYFVFSIILLILCFVNYYLPINKEVFFPIYLSVFFVGFIFKICFFLLNKNKIFRFQWYYKFLYICTLQIAPLFALWELLF